MHTQWAGGIDRRAASAALPGNHWACVGYFRACAINIISACATVPASRRERQTRRQRQGRMSTVSSLEGGLTKPKGAVLFTGKFFTCKRGAVINIKSRWGSGPAAV